MDGEKFAGYYSTLQGEATKIKRLITCVNWLVLVKKKKKTTSYHKTAKGRCVLRERHV